MLGIEEKEEVLSLDEGADDEDEEIINRFLQFITSKYQVVVTKYHNVSLLVSSNRLVNEIRQIGIKQVTFLIDDLVFEQDHLFLGDRQPNRGHPSDGVRDLLPAATALLPRLVGAVGLPALRPILRLARLPGTERGPGHTMLCGVDLPQCVYFYSIYRFILNCRGRSHKQEWWWSSRVMDSCPELIEQYPTILLLIFGMSICIQFAISSRLVLSSFAIQIVVWISVLLSPYLWYLALGNHWEDFIKRDKATFTAKRTLLFNTVLVSFLLASDLHLLFGSYFADSSLWQFPVDTPLGNGTDCLVN
jgi:hypothetical protein